MFQDIKTTYLHPKHNGIQGKFFHDSEHKHETYSCIGPIWMSALNFSPHNWMSNMRTKYGIIIKLIS
jgi:hypothetical protein